MTARIDSIYYFDYTKDIISNTEKMSLNKNILTKIKNNERGIK